MQRTTISTPGFVLKSLLFALVGCLTVACGGGGGGGAPAIATPSAAVAAPDPSLAAATNWSSPATWGGVLPTPGSLVVVPAGKHIVLDIDPPALAGIVVEGMLEAPPSRDLQLTAGYIVVRGTLRIGAEGAPFTRKATITLNGSSSESIEGMGTRGILVAGGTLDLHGVAPTVAWTQINAHVAANATSLTLKTPVSWTQGDSIVIAPTDFYGMVETQKVTLASNVSNTTSVPLAQPVTQARWGLLQHVTNSGMSLTPDPSFVPPATPFPTVLDERAEVGNLTRNIVIQSANDSEWTTNGFGAQVMAMGTGAKMRLDGVEMRRVGQSGRLARYPVHWHRLGYDAGTGALLADSTGQYLRNSSISGSANRCVVIHATNGLNISNNICHDIKGHAFFLEDAVERRNTFENNLALKVRNQTGTAKLQMHEGDVFSGGSSGFWLTNPDNVIRGNVVADVQGNGFWNAFPAATLGLSKNVNIKPYRIKHSVFEYNVAHSTGKPGIMIDAPPIDDAGNTSGDKYIPTSDEGPDRYALNRLRFELKRNTIYKSKEGAYRNRVSWPDYMEWVTADSEGTYFAGAGDDGNIQRNLAVGASLNNLNESPNIANEPRVIFASYHSTFNMANNVIVNVPFVAGKSSGTFKTDDYYITAVDKGTIRNGNNRLINSSPGFRFLPPALLPPVANDNWTLAGALWDPHGYWGTAGQFTVYNVPFLTHDATCQDTIPAGFNGKSCNGEYYGVGDFTTDFDNNRYIFKAAISVDRLASNGNFVGNWAVGDGNTSQKLGNMRHFAARTNGEYIMRFPNNGAAKIFEMSIKNAWRSSDTFVMAVSYSGNANPVAYTVNTNGNRSSVYAPTGVNRRVMTAATSLAEVRTNSTGDKYWIDNTNQLIWFKYKGGLPIPPPSESGILEMDIYNPTAVVINGL